MAETLVTDQLMIEIDLKKGDEVIRPTFTIISCAAAIICAEATPVVVDACPDTWNMDVEQVATKITRRARGRLWSCTFTDYPWRWIRSWRWLGNTTCELSKTRQKRLVNVPWTGMRKL